MQPPIEALTCSAVLADHGFEVVVHDQRVSESMPVADVDLAVVLTQTYDRSQCYSLRLDKARDLSDSIRAHHHDIPVVACGVHADLEPAMTTAALGIPCLPGEVEVSVPWLCERLFTDGLSVPEINLQAAPRQADPDRLPTPDFGAVDMSRYRSEIVDPTTGSVHFGRAGLLFANRGCPYTCSYCHVWFGRKLRTRQPARVLTDIRALVDAGTRQFFFLDYTFTFDRAWTLELCELLAAAELGVTWVCQTRCENVDASVLAAMRRGGCVGVYYGIETPWIADANVRKHTRRAVIDNAISETVAQGLHPFVFVLLGLEGYEASRRDELVDWLRALPATFSARPLLPRPHTTLFLRQPATSWEELESQAVRLANEYWPPELELLQEQLLALPNNVLNAPVEA